MREIIAFQPIQRICEIEVKNETVIYIISIPTNTKQFNFYLFLLLIKFLNVRKVPFANLTKKLHSSKIEKLSLLIILRRSFYFLPCVNDAPFARIEDIRQSIENATYYVYTTFDKVIKIKNDDCFLCLASLEFTYMKFHICLHSFTLIHITERSFIVCTELEYVCTCTYIHYSPYLSNLTCNKQLLKNSLFDHGHQNFKTHFL